MAFKFGKISLKRLEKTEPFIQEIMHEVLKISTYDFGILLLELKNYLLYKIKTKW